MKICVIGTGYVGLTIGACFADIGHEVYCCDIDSAKINNLSKGIISIFEPGISEIVNSNLIKKRLFFTTDIKNAIQKSNVCFITVGTPQKKDGNCDLSHLFAVAELIANSIKDYKVIVNKSTTPVGTTYKIKTFIKSITSVEFDIVSNPEFLSQGSAIRNFLNPDRIIIGTDSQKAIKIMKDIYGPFLFESDKLITMDTKSAELAKYASNAFLASKISFINEIANLCEKFGADMHKVKQGIASDLRIGDKFLNFGIGFGGSCFPKDINALIKMGKEQNCNLEIINSVKKVNLLQRKLFLKKIYNRFNQNISGKIFSVWGLSFKPGTNDMREAPSIDIINELIAKGAKIKAFDPMAISTAKNIFKKQIEYKNNSLAVLKNSDALIIFTEWNEFRTPDFNKIKSLLKNPIIFDGRNLYDKNELTKYGFEYIGSSF